MSKSLSLEFHSFSQQAAVLCVVFRLQILTFCFMVTAVELVSSLPQGHSALLHEAATLKAHPRQRKMSGIVQVLSPFCLTGAGPERVSR